MSATGSRGKRDDAAASPQTPGTHAMVGGTGTASRNTGHAATRRTRLGARLRLRKSNDFRDAYEQGPARVGRCMVLRLRHGEGAGLRLGVVASKRTFRRAVDRNRAKRRLREAYRLNRHRFAGEADVVLVARRYILDASWNDVQRDLLRVAAQAGIVVRERPGA